MNKHSRRKRLRRTQSTGDLLPVLATHRLLFNNASTPALSDLCTQAPADTCRASRVTFLLPPPPSRPTSILVRQRRWSLPENWFLISKDTFFRWIHFQRNAASLPPTIQIGSKVRLFLRPLPIIGTVKFIGQVHFDQGDWLGLEFTEQVGNCDGSYQGQRYFETRYLCALFVKREEVLLIQ
ncbi:hypothetical protein G6F46_009749 [Rhizopus delemar]|uniref:CAP-Gly domain-containing protein n=3 Tax=Rhizopus TaxID=4842 RepID=I1BYN1_RHIO9|nr:hypothetical protein RO3G_06016 [Rhizopus delemar RA 99-880]KAG1452246.1 hypothetical protein G6F55_008780 [Rhizopus delemar]KAG1541921.1 hypothetical protein G6F51_007595 [Rhizopus arrhizus]KAG1492215.1 hypothetical protein G6F54_009468 [Rhizopus delemar]KAG1509214.1 hypothetical protein G6F53_007615 [Rhizopus delemar]|eukprot:EIE81311.1 hypothetical protein RO3G_06016 [Rhizopus delemar RA 99-880]